MPTPAENAYRAALIEARNRGYSLSAASVRAVETAFRDALARLVADAGAGTITPERAEALRREIVALLEILERESARATATGSERIVRDLAEIHRQATADVAARYGVDGAAMSARFDTVAARALQAMASRGDVAVHFRTLMRRHILDAAPAVDRVLRAGVAQGMATRRLAEDVAEVMNGGKPQSLRAAGLSDPDLAGLRTLRYDALRIARSETMHALREGGRQAAVASPVIRGVTWQLSGRHVVKCECDVLAETDFYGLGAGVYPPERFPVAPHPFCACYQGRVVLRPPSEWTSAKGAPPGLAVDPRRVRFPSNLASGWSDKRTERVRQTVAAALAVDGPRSRMTA